MTTPQTVDNLGERSMQIHVSVIRDSDDSFVARVQEFPELLASAFTPAELREAVEEQIEWFAGERLRLPADAFDDLAFHAERELAVA